MENKQNQSPKPQIIGLGRQGWSSHSRPIDISISLSVTPKPRVVASSHASPTEPEGLPLREHEEPRASLEPFGERVQQVALAVGAGTPHVTYSRTRTVTVHEEPKEKL